MSEDKSKDQKIKALFAQIKDFLALGNIKAAEQCLDKITEMLPQNDPDTYELRAEFFEMTGNLDQAIVNFNKVISLDPAYTSYIRLAKFFDRNHQKDNALFNYNKAIEVDNSNSFAYLARAEFYEKHADLQKALDDYNKTISLEPKNPFFYASRSSFYRQQLIPEKLELALKDIQEACKLLELKEIIPSLDTFSFFRFDEGLILLDLHRYSQAADAFEKALKSEAVEHENLESLIEFYQSWSCGLSAYYQADDFKQAREYFSEAKSRLENFPEVFQNNYNVLYIAGLLESYLQLIPMDNKLKDVLSEPDKLPQRTEALDGLREFFSGMFKLSDGMLVEIDFLLEAKRDICALLLPLAHPQAIKPADSAKVLEDIQGNLEFLKYEHTAEIIRILKDNRQRLEQDKPFSKELTKMGDMADGMMTFGTSGSAISDRMGELIKVPEAEEEEITLVDPKTGSTRTIRRKFRYITKESREYRTLSGREEKPLTPAKINLVNARELIMQKRKDAGLIIPPQAHEALMQFISRNTQVKIETFIKEQWLEIGTYLPSQLEGFQHKQGDSPLMVWNLLVGFALTGPAGHPPPEGEGKTASRKSRDKFRKQIDDLNKKLQRLLGITDKAIILDRQTGNWKPAINLRSSRHSME